MFIFILLALGVDVAAAVDNVDQYIGLTNVVQESVSFPTTFENICARRRIASA